MPFIDHERSRYPGAISSCSERHDVDGRSIAGPIAPTAANPFAANTPTAADWHSIPRCRRSVRQSQADTPSCACRSRVLPVEKESPVERPLHPEERCSGARLEAWARAPRLLPVLRDAPRSLPRGTRGAALLRMRRVFDLSASERLQPFRPRHGFLVDAVLAVEREGPGHAKSDHDLSGIRAIDPADASDGPRLLQLLWPSQG